MSEPEPIYSALRNDANTGAYYLDWYCARPPEGAEYEIVREEPGGWRLGHPVRKIFAVQLLRADERRPAEPGQLLDPEALQVLAAAAQAFSQALAAIVQVAADAGRQLEDLARRRAEPPGQD